MRLAVIGYIFLTVGMCAGLYVGHQADVELKHEISARCHQSQEGRQALRIIIRGGEKPLAPKGTRYRAYQDFALSKLPPIKCGKD